MTKANAAPSQRRRALFPARLDNNYEGSRVALVGFWIVTIVAIVRSLVHLFAPDGGAQSIATIPLDSYSVAAATAIIHVFALYGLSQLIVGLLYFLALIRYRTLIPLLYLLAVIEYLVRLALTLFKSMETEATAPGAIGNYVLVSLLLAKLLLSLRRRPGVANT